MRSNLTFLKNVGHILIGLLFLTTNAKGQNDTGPFECPYFQVIAEDTSSALNFSLLSTNIDATISGVIANVVIEQVYVNSSDDTLNTQYVFPMSTQSAVYDMEMDVNGRIIKAKIETKDVAKQLFEEAQDSGKTATLLEQNRPNVFTMSLANVLPDDTIKVRLFYTELLVPEKNNYQFVVPSIVGSRFTFNNEDWVENNLRSLREVQETELNINVIINAGMNVTANCPSHDMIFSSETDVTSGTLNTNPGSDFIVDYNLQGGEIETGLLLYEGEEESFFIAMIQPPKNEISFSTLKREYVFIIDVSGSMSGIPLDISKDLITNILEGLNESDKFNILFFAGGSTVFAENSVPVTPENIDAAQDMIDNINAGGYTDLLSAVNQSLAMEGTAGYSRTFVMLTDGYVTVEKETYNTIRESMGEANFFAFGIGSSVNREIIEGIAYVGEGEPFVVTDLSQAQEKADLFEEYIETPALTNIQSSFQGVDVYDVEPLSIPDVFADRPVLIFGKYKNATNGSLTLTGDYDGTSISKTLYFSDYDDSENQNVALQYLWARRKIKLMSDYGIGSNEDDTLTIEEEVTQLGLKYHLVTEYTSFIAIDEEGRTTSDGVSENDGSGEGEIITSLIDDFDIIKENQISYIKFSGSNVIYTNLLEFTIEVPRGFSGQELKIIIADFSGNVMSEKEISTIDLEHVFRQEVGYLKDGMYILSLIDEKGFLSAERFIKVN